jgi:hypothetical protein
MTNSRHSCSSNQIEVSREQRQNGEWRRVGLTPIRWRPAGERENTAQRLPAPRYAARLRPAQDRPPKSAKRPLAWLNAICHLDVIRQIMLKIRDFLRGPTH